MPDLLLELFSEEIPARMQRRAADDLRRLVTDALVAAGLVYEGARAFATPRRLTLSVHGVPARSPDTTEERKGPRVGAPEGALQGFLKAAGLASIDQATIQSDPRKGDFYVAISRRPGRSAEEVIAEAVPRIVREFPWPKSMRWGDGTLRWVRPLHSILCTFGSENDEPEIIRFAVDGIAAGNLTRGHRFMAPGEITAKRFDDYVDKLAAAKVVLDADRRKDIVLHDARDRAFALGLELIEDEGLLEEVAGLNEWPVVLVGSFDEAFLSVPPEAIRATIRVNQKCFVLRDQKTGGLANRFVMVANIEATDGGRAIVAGSERVIRARLSDARHFWETDRRPLPDHDTEAMREAAAGLGLDLGKPLDQRMAKLAATGVVFHEKLGTQGQRVERLVRLSQEIAPLVGADPALAARAAALAKADLVTEMVGEFPELQGLMGRYYATDQGEHPSVAAAIEDHYKPQGPADRVPTDPVAIAVALADKLDVLTGFWAIDEKPTGSKDPYALRRAALGLIRIVLENQLRLRLAGVRVDADLLSFFADRLKVQLREQGARHDLVDAVLALGAAVAPAAAIQRSGAGASPTPSATGNGKRSAPAVQVQEPIETDVAEDLADTPDASLADIASDYGAADATPALSAADLASEFEPAGDTPVAGQRIEPTMQDDLLLIVRRVEALGRFLDTEDGRNLLAGYRRAANILRAEEKSGERFTGAVDPALLAEPEERTLAEAVARARAEAGAAVAAEDFAAAMAALARLRSPVDSFFDKVLVNAPDTAVRANRLRLLDAIRSATLEVADFSRVQG